MRQHSDCKISVTVTFLQIGAGALVMPAPPKCLPSLAFEPSVILRRHTVEFWEGKAMKDLLEPLGIIVLGAVVVKLTALLFGTAVGASIAAALWH